LRWNAVAHEQYSKIGDMIFMLQNFKPE
jgi:hypothetical protein